MMIPMVIDRLCFNPSASTFGRYPASRAYSCTFLQVASLMSGWFFNARDTVDGDTFNAFAMSPMDMGVYFFNVKKA